MHNVKPKKALGQHFLIDGNIARKIVGSLEVEEGDGIVEIGPGKGVLTKLLLEKFGKLHTVEFDSEAVAYLAGIFKAEKGLTLIHADFLKWDPASNLESPHHFIGNLPYNVSSPIFFHLLDNRQWVKTGIFMIQKEVAERICAPPGSKTYGILSVILGTYFDLEYLFSVSEKVFFPRPKVQSGVIRLRRKPTDPDVSFEAFKSVVKTAFQQRRKTLRNALNRFIFKPDNEKEATLLAQILMRRAETLSIDEFIFLTRLAYEKET